MLEQEIETFEKHLGEWQRSRLGQCVLIKGGDVVGFYSTTDEALTVGAQKFGLEPFLIREITPSREPVWIPALALGVIGAPYQHSVPGEDPKP